MELNDNQKKWIAALRNGEYKQTKGVLHSNYLYDGVGMFCCLGVACDVAVKSGLDITVVRQGRVSYDDCKTIPPASVSTKFLGLRPDAEMALMRMNDDEGKTFAQIADELEAHPEKYFRAE